MIEVRLNVADMPIHDGPEKYFDWLEQRLKDAGIPVSGDKLLRGSLCRFDDPNDFGCTVYRWKDEPDSILDRLGKVDWTK